MASPSLAAPDQRCARPSCRLTVALGVLAAAAVPACRPNATATGPHVVLVVVDALRADRLTPYGYALDTSPFLAALSREAAVFDQAWAQAPWTSSSLASLFTGLDPSAHGVQRTTGERAGALTPDRLGERAHTLAEILRDAGYQTILVSANPWLHPAGGLPQGFDAVQLLAPDTPASAVRERALALLERGLARQVPVFLYVHFMDLHGVYRNPPAPHGALFSEHYQARPARPLRDGEKARFGYIHERLPVDDLRDYQILYDRSIHFVDAEIERLRQGLRTLGIEQHTLLVVTADHGEAFLEHGLAEHGTGLHQEQTRVPLLIAHPGRIAPSRQRAPVQLCDLFPTILELTGGALPADTATAVSLVPFLATPSQPPEPRPPRTAWMELHGGHGEQAAMVADGRQWIYDIAAGALVEAYDVTADPGQEKDVLGDVPDTERARVEAAIEARLADGRRRADRLGLAPRAADLPPATREALESLGYLE